jgi:quercetin dioxygenase-like cupin family protein
VALVGGGLVSLATIPPAGAIGRHPAVSEQLFCVVAGSGWVSGGDGAPSSIVAGQAAWWEAGETHGVETEGGLTALIVQGAFTLPS